MARTLLLHRPLISFDLETTGLNVNDDRILELSCVKMLADGGRDILTLRLNPQRPISPEAQAIHGISNEDVAACPTFADEAQRLAQFMAGCDLTGFNVERFDIPMLAQEFARVGHTFPEQGTKVVDSFRIFCHFEPRDLTAAYKKFCNGTLENAHSAEADAVAAADILLAQLQQYDELPQDAEALHSFCHPVRPDWVDGDGKIVWQGAQAALGFGKHRGRTLQEMAQDEPNYLRWIVNGQFSADVQKICRDALDGSFPVPAGMPEAAPPSAQPAGKVAAPLKQASLF